MKKVYTLKHDDTWLEIKVQIDFDHQYIDFRIKEMVEFWAFWESRLRLADGDYTKAFLKQLAVQVFPLIVGGNTHHQILDHFKDLEGWIPMDGSHGIKILEHGGYTIDEGEFEIIKEEVI